jgi:hypothetical protein
MDGADPLVHRYLLIAGTGRAGTSFLVRYLAELGLDTHLARSHGTPGWDEYANTGNENLPFLSPGKDLPYVIKSPWLYEFIDSLVADVTFEVDAVVIPVRNLHDAAVSRSIIERRAIHQSAPWMHGLDHSWEEWAHVPGGIIYSLNPIDQGRLLAVGFHHLVERLVAANIPIIFLSFPKLIEDAKYLFDKLCPVLPPTVDYDAACFAHRRVADKAKVRVGAEIEATQSPAKPHSARIMRYASHAALDTIALRRELERLRDRLAEMLKITAETAEQSRLEHAAAADEASLQRDIITVIKAALAEAVAARDQANRDKEELAGIFSEAMGRRDQKICDLTRELSQLRDQTLQQQRELETALNSVRTSRSWRLTRPYRAIGSKLINAMPKRLRKS